MVPTTKTARLATLSFIFCVGVVAASLLARGLPGIVAETACIFPQPEVASYAENLRGKESAENHENCSGLRTFGSIMSWRVSTHGGLLLRAQAIEARARVA